MNGTISQYWRSPERQHIYSCWIFLVVVNAAFPFFLSLNMMQSINFILGIALAIVSFIVIYAEIDAWLLSKQYTQMAKQLKLAATIKIATFVFPFIDMFVGAAALEISRNLTGIKLDRDYHSADIYEHNPPPLHELQIQELIGSYVTTMIDGFLLSIIVMALIAIIRIIMTLISKKQSNANID